MASDLQGTIKTNRLLSLRPMDQNQEKTK